MAINKTCDNHTCITLGQGRIGPAAPPPLRAVGPWLNYAFFYELVVICCERYLIFPLKRAIICHLEP